MTEEEEYGGGGGGGDVPYKVKPRRRKRFTRKCDSQISGNKL